MDSSLAKATTKGKEQMQSSHCAEEKKENSCLLFASYRILQKYYHGGEPNERHCDVSSNKKTGSHVPSTVSIFEMARAQLLQYTSTKKEDDFTSIFSNPPIADCSLSPKDSDDLELALLLQASAEMFSKRHYAHARELLSLCNQSASPTGTSVQRVVYYYGEALRERIDKETGALPPNRPEGGKEKPSDLEVKPFVSVCYQLPLFFRVAQFAGIQAILDNVKSAGRVHLIDFRIKSGSHWIILMQALANQGDCPLELLKITAVGTSKDLADEIGQRLSSFAAENMKFPFSFKAVVSEMRHLTKDLFDLDTSEVVVVYAEQCLGGMLAWPHHLEAFLRFVKSLNPCVMIVIDTDANTNAPSFMERFSEALFLHAAFFDILETCMKQNNQYRMVIEGHKARKGIHNMITSEGEERTFRNVRLEIWRALFAKFGIKETELSDPSLDQANLMAERSSPGSCTLDMDEKGLIIKWKGTPIAFVSAWKFQHD